MIVQDAAWALHERRRRLPTYMLRRAYYDGNHRLAFATARFRNTFGHLFRAFADNLCTVVVDAVADRIAIAGWAVGEDQASQEAAALWEMDQLALVANEIHQEALALGDAYLVVWNDDPERVGPVWHPNAAEDMVVRYDRLRPGRISFAAKVWEEPDRARMTLYYPDRIERYATRERSPNGIPTDPRSFLPWRDETGPEVVANPYDVVPVFHFGNSSRRGKIGRAQHDQAIPLQDALNKSILDTLVGEEFMGLPQRWATGLELPIDPVTGEQLTPTPGPGRLWHTPADGASFGQFDAANLQQMLAVSDSFRMEIARVTGTPAHRLMLGGGSAQFPSGEALKVAEAPLVATVGDRHESWGPVWGWAMSLGLRMALTPVSAPLRPLWVPPGTRSEVEDVTVAEAKARLGVSRRQNLRELGYSDDEIERMIEEEAQDRARAIDRGAVA